MTWKRFQRVILILLAVCAGGMALLCLLGGMGFTPVIGQVDSGEIVMLALLLIFLLVLLVWGDGAIVRSTKGWGRGIALTAALAAEGLFLAVLLFFLALGDCGTRYIHLPAPEGRPTLVAREESWLQGGWGSFYWQTRPGWLRDTGVTYITDDGFRPFEHGCYELEWAEDSVTVRFDTSAGWDSRVVPLP